MFSLFLLTSDQWSEFNHVPGPRWGLSSTKLMRLRPRSCWGSRGTWSGMSAPWWPAPSPPPSTPGHSGQGRTRLERTFSIFHFSYYFMFFQPGAPKRLLKSQEMSLLKDIKDAIDKRVENRIATARRFAVCTIHKYSLENIEYFPTRSVWGITPRWSTVIWQLSKTTREYLEIKRKFRKTSSKTPANITSTKVSKYFLDNVFLSTYFCIQGYLRWQTSLDMISRTRTLTRTFSTSTLFMISSHFRAPAPSSRAAPSTSSTWPSPTSCLRSSPRTRGGSPRPPSTATSRSMCRKENPPRKNNGFTLHEVRLLVWLSGFEMTSLF